MQSLLFAAVLLSPSAAPRSAVEVQGHRGARAVHPENTLVAFDYALQVGVDTLELDLGVTKDDVVVVIHDQRINSQLCEGPRAAGRPAVRSLTLAELKRFDCGAKKNPRFARQKLRRGTRIPTLAEVFAHVKASKHPSARTVRFNVETKIVPGRPELAPTPTRFVDLVIKVLKAAGMERRTTIQSFDQRTLNAFDGRALGIQKALLIAENYFDFASLGASGGIDVISPNHEWITKAQIDRIHAQKMKVIVWTVNDPTDVRRLVKMGVDGIISDDPKMVIETVASLKKR